MQEEQPAVFELCRYLAHDNREALLATENERCVSIPTDMVQIMLLDEWHHPDLVNGQSPSQTDTFQTLASVLEKNAPGPNSSREAANNHWRNWPAGGTLYCSSHSCATQHHAIWALCNHSLHLHPDWYHENFADD